MAGGVLGPDRRARRLYLPADARCRQLETLVRRAPGARISELAASTGLTRQMLHVYVHRLERERRVRVEPPPEDARRAGDNAVRLHPTDEVRK